MTTANLECDKRTEREMEHRRRRTLYRLGTGPHPVDAFLGVERLCTSGLPSSRYGIECCHLHARASAAASRSMDPIWKLHDNQDIFVLETAVRLIRARSLTLKRHRVARVRECLLRTRKSVAARIELLAAAHHLAKLGHPLLAAAAERAYVTDVHMEVRGANA